MGTRVDTNDHPNVDLASPTPTTTELLIREAHEHRRRRRMRSAIIAAIWALVVVALAPGGAVLTQGS